MNTFSAFRAPTALLIGLLLLNFHPTSAQRNQWQPDSTAYEYLSKGENATPFRSNRLSEITVDSLRFKNNPYSIRWTIPPNSGTAVLTFDLGDRDMREYALYMVCSRNNNINTLTCFANTASGGKYRIGPVVKTNNAGFHLPVTDWHQTGQFLAGTLSNTSQAADLAHVVSISFEAGNSAGESILWIDEIRMIRPRGPVAAINFNRYRDQADTSLTPWLLQRGIKANVDFNYAFASERKIETYNAIPFQSIGLGRIDTLVNQHGWSCSSHGTFYDQMTFLSPQSRYRLFALDSFIASGFDARWCFAIPKDKVTPSIMKEIWDYGQFRSIRRQGQDIQNLPVTNPLDLGFFRPTSRLAGPNLNGTPLLLDEMKEFVDSCVRHKGLIILDFGTLVYTPSPLYTDVETTLMSDATALIDYVDSLGLPFLTFEELFGDDSSYAPSLTASNDHFVLTGLSTQSLPVLQNDVWGPGAVLQVQLLAPPLHGNASVNGTQITYTPDSTCFTTDNLAYVLSDGIRSDTAQVRIRRMQNSFTGEKTFHCSPTRFDVEAIVNGGVSPYSYSWSTGSTAQSVNLQGGSTYVLTITDSVGCTLIDSITLPNRIKPAALTTNSIQCGSGIPTCSAFAEAGTLIWYTDSLSTTPVQQGGNTYAGIIDSTTTLYVSVNYGTCTSVRTPVTVTVSQPTVSIVRETDTIGCFGSAYILRATTGPNLLYQWRRNGQLIPNAVNSRLVTGQPGIYTVDVIRPEDSCTTVSEPVSIVQIDSAVITTDDSTTFCLGDSILLSTTNSSFFDYTWYLNGVAIPNSNRADLWVSLQGNYSVEIDGPGSCLLISSPVTVSASGTATSNTVVASACDSYTWTINGNTYTQSGNYTSVVGCATEILDLTITASTSTTVADSACDSYTWTINGNTYTQSGTYTSVNGCETNVLLLDITVSGGSSNTVTAIDSFFWSVNGQTYTQSGTYVNNAGCQTDTLILTISPTTGIANVNQPDFLILKPNPASELLEISWSNDINANQLRIIDGLGKTHMVLPLQDTQSSVRLNIAHFPSGLYIAILENGQECYSRRWMKQ